MSIERKEDFSYFESKLPSSQFSHKAMLMISCFICEYLKYLLEIRKFTEVSGHNIIADKITFCSSTLGLIEASLTGKPSEVLQTDFSISHTQSSQKTKKKFYFIS